MIRTASRPVNPVFLRRYVPGLPSPQSQITVSPGDMDSRPVRRIRSAAATGYDNVTESFSMVGGAGVRSPAYPWQAAVSGVQKGWCSAPKQCRASRQ